MAAAPMSKLNFTSQTNDAHEKFPDEFSHPEVSRQSCRNPPIAMLLRKSNATMDLVGEQTHFSILIKHAVVIAFAKKWQIDFRYFLKTFCLAKTAIIISLKNAEVIEMNLQWTNTCFSTRVFHKYTKLPGCKARSVDCHIVQI
ncbi:hypothetical protein T08_2558 [Trichinella sp. T8]|nr:hypothetical protein T08_2558 [Trichinella sp. T8]